MQVSNSQFSSPVNLVKKPHGGGYRVTYDYRKLQGSLVKGSYPLPLIDDLLASFNGSRWFTTIDLKNAFFQVPLETDMDRKLTAVTTQDGVYEFLVMPQGLATSRFSCSD